ncbi:hypothetical protein GEMRC1_013652 [Eukaryota sp. GEM-RC1]
MAQRNLPPLISSRIDPTHRKIYSAAGLLIVDTEHPSGTPYCLMAHQIRPRAQHRHLLHIIGGNRSSRDLDVLDTAFREFYESTGELVDGSAFEALDAAYDDKKTVVLYYPPSKYLLIVVSLSSFYPEDQEILRYLPQDFDRKFSGRGTREVDGLEWVPFFDLLNTCKSSFILFKKKQVDSVDFRYGSSADQFGLPRISVEILGRAPVSDYLQNFFA